MGRQDLSRAEAISMIASLVERDPALRSLPRLILKGLALSAVISQVWIFQLSSLVPRSLAGPSTQILPFLALWMPLSIYLMTSGTRTRCGSIDLTFPLPSSSIWLSHLFAVLLGGLAIMVASGAVLGLHEGLLHRLVPRSRDLVTIALPELMGSTGAGYLLVVVVLQSFRPSERRVDGDRRFLILTVGLLIGLGFVVTSLASFPRLVWIAMPVLAMLVAVRAYVGLPASLTLLTSDSLETIPNDLSLVRTPIDDKRGVLVWTVLRAAFAGRFRFQPLIAMPFLALYGMVLAGILGWRYGHNAIQFSHIPLAAYILLAFNQAPLLGFHRLDPLPISRKTLFAFLVLPSLAVLSLGYGGGRLWVAHERWESAPILCRNVASHCEIMLPVEYLKVSSVSNVPRIVSPSGESHEAWSTTLFPGCPIAIYSPYRTREESSADYTAFLISQAAERIYDTEIPTSLILEKYLELEEDGTGRATRRAIPLESDFPHLSRHADSPSFPFVLLAIGLLWFGSLSLYLRTFRAGTGASRRKWTYVAILTSLLAVHIGQYVLDIVDGVDLWIWTALLKIGLRQLSDLFPGGSVAIWGICLSLLALAYRATSLRFQRVELPADATSSAS